MSGGITNSGDMGRLLEDGVNSAILAGEKTYEPEFPKILTVQGSKKAYETDVPFADFGIAKVKDQGASIEYDDMKTGNSKKYQHVNYALGAIITKEAIDDNLYMDMSQKAGKGLIKALNQTKEIVGANVFNNGYASTTTWDGEFLFSASHKQLKGGTYANMLPVAAPLSEASLEDAIIAISKLTDDAGRIIKVIPQSLHIPSDLMFVAQRILGSTLQSGTANNDTNAIKDLGKFPGGVHVNHFFTDTQNWFIRTDVENGGKFFLRQPKPITGMDNDFGTDDYRHKISQRFSVGVSNPRQYFGSGAN